MIEYQKAKAPTLPKSIDDKVRQLRSDMEQLKQADGNQYQEQLKAAEHGSLLLSGHYVELVTEGVEMGGGVGLTDRRYLADLAIANLT